jgi:hypothetical protein
MPLNSYLSLNTSEHYFSNFYNNFLKEYVNLTLEELKLCLCLNNEINYKKDNLEVINSEDIMEKIYEKELINAQDLKEHYDYCKKNLKFIKSILDLI